MCLELHMYHDVCDSYFYLQLVCIYILDASFLVDWVLSIDQGTAYTAAQPCPEEGLDALICLSKSLAEGKRAHGISLFRPEFVTFFFFFFYQGHSSYHFYCTHY